MNKRKIALLVLSSLLLVGCGNSNQSSTSSSSTTSSSTSDGKVLATKITITTSQSLSYLRVGDTVQFSVDYNVPGCLEGVTWDVEDTKKASIDKNGLLTCKAITPNDTDLAVMATYKHNIAVYATIYIKIHEAPAEKSVTSFSIANLQDTYSVGQRLDDLKDNFSYQLNWSDGSTSNVSKSQLDNYGLISLYSPLDGDVDISNKFNFAGVWRAVYLIKYNGKQFTTNLTLNVLTGLKSGLNPTSITLIKAPLAYHDSIFNPTNVLTFKVAYSNYSKGETFIYNSSLSELFDFSLEDKTNPGVNIIDQKIDKTKNYQFVIKVKGFEVSLAFDLEVRESTGYQLLNTPTITLNDVDSSHCPTTGTLKTLIVPVKFQSGMSGAMSWTDDWLNKINNIYFGDSEPWNSFASYYSTASYGKLSINGFVSEIYTEEDITMSAANNNILLAQNVMQKAVAATVEAHPEIDWTEYDVNNDGCFDSVHVITNAGSDVQWSDGLWPHEASTGVIGTHQKPKANVYSLSCLSHITDARTSIHEQGHIFGLEDYYDYSSTYNYDYIGGADMQSYNCFDWNSYSKFSASWNKPFVIDGTQSEVYVTLNDAASSGECLIIPANYGSYNNSAFDEYIMLELFSPKGNNLQDWTNYYPNLFSSLKKDLTLGDYGVRLYHIDSRLWAYESKAKIDEGHEIHDITELKNNDLAKVTIGANNTKDVADYSGDTPTLMKDNALIAIIPQSKDSQFGISRPYLESQDLFHEGDVFTFDEYSQFMTKARTPVTTMNNGEIFPYKISFVSMSKDEVTIKIEII